METISKSTTEGQAQAIAAIYADINAARETIAELEAEATRLDAECQPLRDKLADAEAEIARLTARRAELPEAITRDPGDEAALLAELDSLPSAMATAAERAALYRQAVARIDATIHALELGVREQQRRIVRAECRVARLAEQQAGREIETAIAHVLATVDQWRAACGELEARYAAAFPGEGTGLDHQLRVARVIAVQLIGRLGGRAAALAQRGFPPETGTFTSGLDRLRD